MVAIDRADNTVPPAKATAEEAALKATGDDNVLTEAKAEMADNLKQAGYE